MKLWKTLMLVIWVILLYPIVFILDVGLALIHKNLDSFRETFRFIKNRLYCIWI